MIDERPVVDRSGARRVAVVSFLWTLGLATAKLVVAFQTGSVALLGDGLHSAIDVVASLLTIGAIRWAAIPPDREHPYGHGRAENLAALAQALVIVGVGGLVAVEAVRRLRTGVVIDPHPYVLAVVGVAIVVDFSRSRVLRRAARRYSSPALEADALNFTGDIAESLAVFAGLLAARLGLAVGDPIAALVVAATMAAMAGRIGRAAVQVLMDRHPPGLAEQVASAVGSVEGVVGVGDLKVRRSGPDVHAEVTVNVGRTASVERSHDITEAIEAAVANALPGATTTVHVEPSREGEDIVARTFAAANRTGMADQIHNVLAIHHPEGIWLMLHAKIPPETELRRAHSVTDELEAELRREIAGLARVEVHLEPREPGSLHGSVVSAHRPELVDEVRRIAEARAPITRCHEVAVSQTPDGLHLVLHCDAPAELTIQAIHDASLQVESDIHDRFDEVRTVTIHFEPGNTG